METRGLIWWKAGLAALGTAAFVVVPAGAAMASAKAGPGDMDPSTRVDMKDAMENEALAHATYRAYAAQADRERLPQVRDLFERTADSELHGLAARDAEQLGLIGDNAANLRDSTGGETYEARTMYKRFAAEAEKENEPKAAALFSEIGNDEASHRVRFSRAEEAVANPSAGMTVPTDVMAKPATIRAGAPEVSSAGTLRNLRTAMRGEAVAHAKYALYAERARETGQPSLAQLFDRTARVERDEHFAEQASLAGLVRDTRTNLRHAITEERRAGDEMYPGYARKATEMGDTTASGLFMDSARGKLAQARAFSEALSALETRAGEAT
ncbi:hypothetical protein GCM10023194_29000 [Planotetraspora phitsanulokensis]|uniref:Ferritin-like diiron domain-containing protein n=1 Tax=Planotetraspora phitsanulokensis TaxID=575192 RepID=A0A8J3XCC0_9ACTN|nr:ferritin family protein [Planotetraspora phitsanulokensis]GII35962.1 hypothetical protein Pph01_09650 [Planotetraspora phitsanulokensis]